MTTATGWPCSSRIQWPRRMGRSIGIVSGSRKVAAGIGFYAAGLSFSERWLVRGQDVAFGKNTRIDIYNGSQPQSSSRGRCETRFFRER